MGRGALAGLDSHQALPLASRLENPVRSYEVLENPGSSCDMLVDS